MRGLKQKIDNISRRQLRVVVLRGISGKTEFLAVSQIKRLGNINFGLAHIGDVFIDSGLSPFNGFVIILKNENCKRKVLDSRKKFAIIANSQEENTGYFAHGGTITS